MRPIIPYKKQKTTRRGRKILGKVAAAVGKPPLFPSFKTNSRRGARNDIRDPSDDSVGHAYASLPEERDDPIATVAQDDVNEIETVAVENVQVKKFTRAMPAASLPQTESNKVQKPISPSYPSEIGVQASATRESSAPSNHVYGQTKSEKKERTIKAIANMITRAQGDPSVKEKFRSSPVQSETSGEAVTVDYDGSVESGAPHTDMHQTKGRFAILPFMRRPKKHPVEDIKIEAFKFSPEELSEGNLSDVSLPALGADGSFSKAFDDVLRRAKSAASCGDDEPSSEGVEMEAMTEKANVFGTRFSLRRLFEADHGGSEAVETKKEGNFLQGVFARPKESAKGEDDPSSLANHAGDLLIPVLSAGSELMSRARKSFHFNHSAEGDKVVEELSALNEKQLAADETKKIGSRFVSSWDFNALGDTLNEVLNPMLEGYACGNNVESDFKETCEAPTKTSAKSDDMNQSNNEEEKKELLRIMQAEFANSRQKKYAMDRYIDITMKQTNAPESTRADHEALLIEMIESRGQGRMRFLPKAAPAPKSALYNSSSDDTTEEEDSLYSEYTDDYSDDDTLNSNNPSMNKQKRVASLSSKRRSPASKASHSVESRNTSYYYNRSVSSDDSYSGEETMDNITKNVSEEVSDESRPRAENSVYHAPTKYRPASGVGPGRRPVTPNYYQLDMVEKLRRQGSASLVQSPSDCAEKALVAKKMTKQRQGSNSMVRSTTRSSREGSLDASSDWATGSKDAQQQVARAPLRQGSNGLVRSTSSSGLESAKNANADWDENVVVLPEETRTVVSAAPSSIANASQTQGSRTSHDSLAPPLTTTEPSSIANASRTPGSLTINDSFAPPLRTRHGSRRSHDNNYHGQATLNSNTASRPSGPPSQVSGAPSYRTKGGRVAAAAAIIDSFAQRTGEEASRDASTFPDLMQTGSAALSSLGSTFFSAGDSLSGLHSSVALSKRSCTSNVVVADEEVEERKESVSVSAKEMEVLKNHATILGIDVTLLVQARLEEKRLEQQQKKKQNS